MNTRCFPRTMQQAFGPYTDNRLEPMPDEPGPLARFFERLLFRICGH